MKWLYRILRLFFCPHKDDIIDHYEITKTFKSGNTHKELVYLNKCKYCGRLKNHKVEA
jgi:aspartate carbamoyltransferase regulatory subunit